MPGRLNRIPMLRQRAEKIANIWAIADKSDPFTRNRILSHYDNGIGEYEGELVREKRSFVNHSGIEQEHFVQVPKNMKRP